MKILVGVKHVPDTETEIRIAADGRSIDESSVKWIMSPYDEYALEAALALREARGGGDEVVAVSAGRDTARSTLRQALATGADRAILIEDVRFERCDGLVRAQALAAVVRAEEPGLVLLGKYGVGGDEGQTGPMLAELLDWPGVSAVCRFELVASGFVAEREVEGGREIVEGALPAVVSCDKGLNEPRYPSLKGIMQAKKKPLEVRTPTELGLDSATLDSPLVVLEALEPPPARRAGVRILAPPLEAAEQLVRILHEETKVL